MLFRRFESLIDVFKPSPDVAPPTGMLRFYSHYLKQVWPLMLAVLIIGFFAALIEVALFSYLSRIIDLADERRDGRPHRFADRGGSAGERPRADRADDEQITYTDYVALLRAAIQERSDAERHVLEAIRAARVAGMPWSAIGLFVGTSGEAARQRYGHKVE